MKTEHNTKNGNAARQELIKAWDKSKKVNVRPDTRKLGGKSPAIFVMF